MRYYLDDMYPPFDLSGSIMPEDELLADNPSPHVPDNASQSAHDSLPSRSPATVFEQALAGVEDDYDFSMDRWLQAPEYWFGSYGVQYGKLDENVQAMNIEIWNWFLPLNDRLNHLHPPPTIMAQAFPRPPQQASSLPPHSQVTAPTGMPPGQEISGNPRPNCSFWLTNLPADVTIQEITDQIRGCGRIYLIQIQHEEGYRLVKREDEYGIDRLVTKGAAANVTFFDDEGQKNFHQKFVVFEEAQGGRGRGGYSGSIWIRGRKVRCQRNRNRASAHNGFPRNHTRVVRVTGPPHVVNVPFLLGLLDRKFIRYELEQILNHSTDPRMGDLEFRFAGYGKQAREMFDLLRNPEKTGVDLEFWNGVYVDFWLDPCDVPYVTPHG